MPEWEYRKIALNQRSSKTDDIDLLCDAGEDGWELVAILTNNIAYLKRQLGELASAPIAHNGDATSRAQDASANGSGNAAAVKRVHEVKVKYRHPVTNETWSGRGRMANWLKRKQDAGEDIDKYLV